VGVGKAKCRLGKTRARFASPTLNSSGDDEAVLFADAVHPTHAARPAGCWAPKQEKLGEGGRTWCHCAAVAASQINRPSTCTAVSVLRVAFGSMEQNPSKVEVGIGVTE
jgi:hypothetical protein